MPQKIVQVRIGSAYDADIHWRSGYGRVVSVVVGRADGTGVLLDAKGRTVCRGYRDKS